MWSTPPAEPPPTATLPASALSASTRSFTVLNGELGATAIALYSMVSRASGVDLLERHRRLVRQDAADHDRAHHHHGVVVALRGADELGEADGAAGAALVGDLGARLVEALGVERRQDGASGASQPPPGWRGPSS